jgi:hypothetical protein
MRAPSRTSQAGTVDKRSLAMLDEYESGLWTEDDESGYGYDIEADDDGDAYEALRPLLTEDWRDAPPGEIEALLDDITSSMTAEEAESFWSTVSNIGRSIAPIAGQVLSVAAPIVGGAVGGPVGAALGNTVGSLAGGALSSLGGRPAAPVAAAVRAPLSAAVAGVANAATRAIPGIAAAAVPVAAAVAPAITAVAPAVAAPLAGAGAGSSATSQLLSLLQNPQMLQSMLQQLLGAAGGSAVAVGSGGASAPFGAFMNALSVLAGRAAGEAESESTDASYLYGANGELIADPNSPDERAAALLAHLQS